MITNRSSCSSDTKNVTSTTANGSKAASRIIELPVNELDALIGRVEQAEQAQLTLSPEDCDLLLNAVLTLSSMQERLSHNDLTISKLKNPLGMMRSSEKMKDLFSDAHADAGENKADNKGSSDRRDSRDKRNGQKASGKPQKRRSGPKAPTTHKHPLQGLSKGDPCPACPGGKLYSASRKHHDARVLATQSTQVIPLRIMRATDRSASAYLHCRPGRNSTGVHSQCVRY